MALAPTIIEMRSKWDFSADKDPSTTPRTLYLRDIKTLPNVFQPRETEDTYWQDDHQKALAKAIRSKVVLDPIEVWYFEGD